MQLPSFLSVAVSDLHSAQGELFMAEIALLKDAVPVRQREITAGRVLAHRLMQQMGRQALPVTQYPSGAPLWPEGLVGSIAHSAEDIAVVLGLSSDVLSVGIDIEDGRTLDAATERIATEEEVDQVILHPMAGDKHTAVRWLFSAKEAVFKCQAPLTEYLDLDFDEVRIRLGADHLLVAELAVKLKSATNGIVGNIPVILTEFEEVRIAVAWLTPP